VAPLGTDRFFERLLESSKASFQVGASVPILDPLLLTRLCATD
jgi:hypothetical protein